MESYMLDDLKIKLDLIVVGNALEAITLRSVLESFGVEVRCRFIGHVKELISFLNGNEPLYKIVIISCHGNKKGLILPELAPELETTMPYQRVLTASDCAEFVSLKDPIIINTGCCLGRDDFAKSFIQSGASAYIGFETYPDGNEVLFFVISFLYFYICKHFSLQDAFTKANSFATSLAKLYLKDDY